MFSKILIRKPWATAIALVLFLTSIALAEEKKVNLGVSIPAATHGWTGGVVFWSNQAKKELEKAHPGLKITVKNGRKPR
jgi:ribose transport system substrate-binding protein